MSRRAKHRGARVRTVEAAFVTATPERYVLIDRKDKTAWVWGWTAAKGWIWLEEPFVRVTTNSEVRELLEFARLEGSREDPVEGY